MDALLRFEQGVIVAERPFDPTLKNDPLHYYDIPHLINAAHIELLVAECEGTPIGCGYARIEESKHYLQHKQHAYLGFMYVEPAFRGQGINLQLITELEKWSEQQGITEMRLDVYQQNEPAIQAYQKAGFQKHMIAMRKPIQKNTPT